MLERPPIPDDKIISALQAEYGLAAAEFTFLPVGADLNTAAYRLVDRQGGAFFVKLRRGTFDETSVTLPRFLSDRGIAQIIPPLLSLSGSLWARLDDCTLILYPFVEGRNCYEVELSD